jgi:hypothetical protein
MHLQNCPFFYTTVKVALECELSRIEKVVFAEWFGHKFDRASLHGWPDTRSARPLPLSLTSGLQHTHGF